MNCIVCNKEFKKRRVWQKFCSKLCRYRYWDKKKDPVKKKEYQVERNLKRYGLTSKSYLEMYKKQKGKCKLCGFETQVGYRRLHVDHNHKTREVRGLLCAYCNRKIIGAIEKIGFKKIANYLGYKVEKRKCKNK